MSTVSPIIEKVVQELQSRDVEWTEFAVVWGIDATGKANDGWGYWFTAKDGDPQAFSVAPWDIDESLTPYLSELYSDGNYPIRMLAQFNRDTGRYNIEFEDTDTTRWQITPANLDQAREALRPNLG